MKLRLSFFALTFVFVSHFEVTAASTHEGRAATSVRTFCDVMGLHDVAVPASGKEKRVYISSDHVRSIDPRDSHADSWLDVNADGYKVTFRSIDYPENADFILEITETESRRKIVSLDLLLTERLNYRFVKKDGSLIYFECRREPFYGKLRLEAE